MKKSLKFNDILDECLERLLVRGETIEQCLQSYPEQADELEPLLQTALVTKKASAIRPRPEFKAKARYQFRLALQAVEPKRRLSLFGWQSRWATVVAVTLVLVLIGGSTVVASSNSMPDNPLYQVKLATEQVQLTLTPSALGKAELYTRLADKRVAEIIYIANKGKPKQVEQTAQRLNNCLVMIASLALAEKGGRRAVLAPTPVPAPGALPEEASGARDVYSQVNGRAKLRMTCECYAINHSARLRAVLETAPASTKLILLKAINELEVAYEEALEALD